LPNWKGEEATSQARSDWYTVPEVRHRMKHKYTYDPDPESVPIILLKDRKRWPPNAQDHTLPFRYVIKMMD